MTKCKGIAAAAFAALVLSLAGSTAQAQGDAAFARWLDALRSEALAEGISKATLDASLTGIAPIPRVIELDRHQPESTMTFEQYLSRVVNDRRVSLGRQKYAEHRELLTEVGKRFGVQPRFIVALWGIETNFGSNTGGFPVIEALATLAYDGRRSSYFRRELLHALQILEEGHIAPKAMMGSWAGAMGQSQFMPSSFRNFAYDYDSDGHKDIWGTQADVFASAANYLSKVGWREDLTWGRQVKLPEGFNVLHADLKVKKQISEWQKLGVRRLDGRALPNRKIDASIVLPDGPGGRAYMVYDNYRAIMRWNRSLYFATSVGTLADRIAAN